MFLKSLQTRLVLFICIIAVCLIIPIALFLSVKIEDYYYDQFMVGIKNGLKQWTVDDSLELNVDFVFEEILRCKDVFKMGENKSYTVLDSTTNKIRSNDILFNNGEDIDFITKLTLSKNYISALEGKTGSSRKIESYGAREFFDYALSYDNIIVYFRFYKEEWQGILDAFNNILYASLALAVGLAFIIGFFFSRTITTPITNLMKKAHKVATGDFDQLLEVKSNDEIGRFTESFNYMAQSFKHTLDEVFSEKNKIETVLNYMNDGIVAYNTKGKVIHSNPAAKKLFEGDESWKDYNMFADKYEIGISLDNIMKYSWLKGSEAKIKCRDKILRVTFGVFSDSMGNPGGLIMVLSDFTKQQELDNMQREFVANVSHELKTPLTSIKSYTETLIDGAAEDEETRNNFLEVINTEADRMSRLVQDLLNLSKFDKKLAVNKRVVSIENLVRNSIEKLKIKAKEKNQKLECYISGKIPKINADYDRIEQVILNVITNAIKYTQKRGEILVYISKSEKVVVIRVVDNGIGIPEKDLPRVFERFYRVDKARSRKLGGTGLGLSIAREIIEAHEGNIAIKSKLNMGTQVTITLPFTKKGEGE